DLPFDLVFDAIVAAIERRPAVSHTQRVQRAQLVSSLRDLRSIWQAAYERTDDPLKPKPTPVKAKTVPLDADGLRRLFWRSRRPKRRKRCRVCGRVFLPPFAHSMTCSRECSREWTRKREREAARERKARAQVPVSV